MVQLRRSAKGAWSARKRIPDAVRDEYKRLYGNRHEDKFSARASVHERDARRLFSEWLLEVEGRIAAIEAAQRGEGVSLTTRQAPKALLLTREL